MRKLQYLLNVPHAREDFSSRRSIAARLVGHNQARHVAQTLQQLQEEALNGALVSAFVHQNVEHIAVLVNGPPQVMLLAVDVDEDLIEKPGVARTGLTPTQ